MSLTHELDRAFHEALLEPVDALPVAQRLLKGVPSKAEYLRYLFQTYHYVLWTVILLRRAAQRMRELGQELAFAKLLALKATQEFSHEAWILSDARELGCSQEEVFTTPPCFAVNLYIAWNQFLVESDTPVAFLGTAYALERLSTERGDTVVTQLRLHSTIPGIQNGLTFLEGHATEDISHAHLLAEKLDDIRNPQARERTVESVRMTGRIIVGLLAAIADESG